MLLKYSRVRSTAYVPVRANPSDAGLDLFYSPEMYGSTDERAFDVLVEPGDSVIIPTGIKLEIPHGYCFEIKNRSGNAAKKSLIVGACVVDSGYEGEIFVNLHNIGKRSQIIEPGMKIAQGLLIYSPPFRLYEVPESELYDNWVSMSNRGTGALGSTGE